MGLQAAMLVSVPSVLTKELHVRIEQELKIKLSVAESDLLKSVKIATPESKSTSPVSTSFFWYEIDIFNFYSGILFSDGYPRGPIQQYVRLAQAIEQILPTARVWYGDADRMDFLTLFDRPERERLLRIPPEGSGTGL